MGSFTSKVWAIAQNWSAAGLYLENNISNPPMPWVIHLSGDLANCSGTIDTKVRLSLAIDGVIQTFWPRKYFVHANWACGISIFWVLEPGQCAWKRIDIAARIDMENGVFWAGGSGGADPDKRTILFALTPALRNPFGS